MSAGVTPIRRRVVNGKVTLQSIGSAPDPAAVAALQRLWELLEEAEEFFSATTIGEPATADALNRICDELEPLWTRLRELAEREEPRFERASDAELT